jgi:RNase P subunit RPR2
MKKISRTEAKEEVEKFFKDLKNKTPKDIKKIKKIAMGHNIKLGDKRKLFCRKCFSPNLKVLRIKDGMKKIKCKECDNESRWKIK